MAKLSLLLSALLVPNASAFLSTGLNIRNSQQCRQTIRSPLSMSSQTDNEVSSIEISSTEDPLLLRAARGEPVERPPVWMMRQAGRHMQVYRDLVKEYPTFRERSEQTDVSTEISLQPWRAYKTDGVILFSDILTPLPSMGVEFDILEKQGPKMTPFTTWEQVNSMKKIEPEKDLPFVGETLRKLREEVGNEATVLGFVGLPYTLATYMVEGGSSKEYINIKKMGFNEPELLHKMLTNLAENIADYAIYQIENGAQIIQVFDSWAGHLSAVDYDMFAQPYQEMVIKKIKEVHPEVPIIIYINKSGALLEKMAKSGADIVSLDWTVSMAEGRARLGDKIGVQGNLDPMILYGSHEMIKERTEQILKEAGSNKHVMNLGHGIDANTPEENAKFFIDTVKAWRY